MPDFHAFSDDIRKYLMSHFHHICVVRDLGDIYYRAMHALNDIEFTLSIIAEGGDTPKV